MEAKDLRIGNIVDAPIDGHCEILSFVKDILNFKNNVWSVEVCKPIPLTEEWLLKFGFEDSLPWKLENLILDSEDRLSIIDDTGYGIIIARDVKYVHRLQNIYTDLKQKELTITNFITCKNCELDLLKESGTPKICKAYNCNMYAKLKTDIL